MKRPLEYMAGGFVLGEVLALLPVVWSIGLSAGVLAGVCWLWVRKGRRMLWWLLPVFCVLGMMCMKGDEKKVREYKEIQGMLEDEKVVLEGTVRGIKEDRDKDRVTLEMADVTLEWGGRNTEYGNVLAYVDGRTVRRSLEAYAEGDVGEGERKAYAGDRRDSPDSPPLRLGMGISLEGSLEGFGEPGNPGEFDYGKYYHSLGIEGRFFGEGMKVSDPAGSIFFDGLYRMKCHGAAVFEAVCTEADKGIFCAMVLGEKSELSADIRKLYQRNGIAHLLAISGLHISLIGMGVYGMCRKAGMGLGWAGLAGAAVTVSYGVLAGGRGMPAGVVRAVLMVLMQMLAGFLGRTYDMRTAAAVSGLFLLLGSPSLLFQAGFQLSFGAVLSLGIAVPAAEKWLDIRGRLAKTVLAGVIIQLATGPLVMVHYYEYPVYGIFLNLIVIPLMPCVLMSGILAVGAGSISLRLGETAVGLGHYILELYGWLCERTQSLPGALMITGRPGSCQLAAYGLVWCGFLAVMMKRGEDRRTKRETWDKGRGWKWVAFSGMVIGSLCILLYQSPVKGMEVTFLDVGQGDGICIRTRDTVILVDGGSTDKKALGDQVLKPFLKSRGIRQVDYVIVSHGDRDHISGLEELLGDGEEIPIRHLILPWLGKDGGDEAYENLEELAESRGIEPEWMGRGDYLRWGQFELECLYAGEEGAKDRNEHSLLLQVRYGPAGVLLTGDMSKKGEEGWLKNGDSTRIQVLKVAHHGSAHSTGEEFLLRVRPEFAVISCGEENRYGHPAPETIKRLEDQGILWYTTMERGALIVDTDGETLGIKSFR